MLSKKILRQLKKAFETDLETQDLSVISEYINKNMPESAEKARLTNLVSGFPIFVNMIEESYEQMTRQVALAKRSLEISSAELYDVNQSLLSINQTFDAMVNSLGQGFFLFNSEGEILSLCSKICESLLEGNPAGKSVADVLKVPEDKRGTFMDWVSMMFSEVIDFEDLAIVGQKFFPHSAGRIVGLEYKPVRDKSGKIQFLVVIATDRTREIEADRKALGMQAYATLVVAILKDRGRFRQYVMHSRRFFQEMRELLGMETFSQNSLALIKRNLHTLKGAAGTFGMMRVKDLLHQVETDLSGRTQINEAQVFLKDATSHCEQLFENLLEEHRDIIGDIIKENKAIREVHLDSLNTFAGRLKAPNTSLDVAYHTFLNEILCVPMKNVLQQFDGLVQLAAKNLRKKVAPLQIHGADIRILPERYGNVWENLEHLFRNLVDHGIETADIRKSLGKPEAGQVSVAFRSFSERGGSMIEIKISDDGKGIDTEAIRQKLVKNEVPGAVLMSDAELNKKIFEAGFSTSLKITETSGRGVGLDAVRVAVEEIGGEIGVESVSDQGTTFTVLLPLFNEPYYTNVVAS